MKTTKILIAAALALLATPVLAATAPAPTIPSATDVAAPVSCPIPNMPSLQELEAEATYNNIPEVYRVVFETGTQIVIWDTIKIFGDPKTQFLIGTFDSHGCFLDTSAVDAETLKSKFNVVLAVE